MPRPDRDTIINTCWPPTNTPTEFDVVSAAVAVRELLHYLNHATGPATLREVTTIHTVTTNVGAAVTRTAPVLDQLAEAITALRQSGALFDDRPGTSPNLAASYATRHLAMARDTLGTLYNYLAAAANELSHLHNQPEGATE
jgi:hypothetical protein